MAQIDPKKLELEAQFLGLLGQPTRLQLLYMLREGEQCACTITPAMREDQSVISRHLTKLRDMGILQSRKEGVSVYYKIADPRVFKLLEQTDNLIRDLSEKRAREAARAL